MTPTFRVIDKHTGREYLHENINTDGLMEMDLDQMYLGEDGTLMMTDDCDRIAYQDNDRFEVVIDGYVSIDQVLEIIDKLYDTTCDRYSKVGYVESARNELRMVQQEVKALKGGEHEDSN